MNEIESLFSHKHVDLTQEQLLNIAITRNEGRLATNHALAVATGVRTGRSPKDRFIVKDDITRDTVDWGEINQPTDYAAFNALWDKAIEYLQQKDVFVSHLKVGESEEHHLPVTVVTELAWHNLFVNNLFIRLKENKAFPHESSWVLLNAAQFETVPEEDGVKSDAAVMIDFTQKRVLICGTQYAGEMKKAMFSILNFLLTEHDVLPMHCAANEGKEGDVTLFFGLSGTGKTTLSADPDRFLIGDDEHGWSEKGVFNFEGGCYAKCINLSKENEPVIWNALRRGTVMENVVLDQETDEPDFDDDSLTQNTRAAYPREFIEKKVQSNQGDIPKAVIFLTCDLYGVLPPVAKLNHEQAAYYFLSGYTALVGSTEVGQTDPVKPTFSTCFGAPFFPRPAHIYADLLIKRVKHAGCPVYLVNTGWTGGAYGDGGERFAIPVTRAVVHGIQSGDIEKHDFETLPGFGFEIPTALDGVDAALLDPRKNWKDQEKYRRYATQLIEKFNENFKRFSVSDAILAASPKVVGEHDE